MSLMPRIDAKKRIRVLIVEDSTTTRTMLVDLFRRAGDFDVAGEASNGAEAIERTIALSPDLVVMDVHMPILDGLDATKEIMREAPTPIVMVSASSSGIESDVSLGLSATQAGALMLVPKPPAPGAPDFEADCEQLLTMARAMAEVKVVRRWGAPGIARGRAHRHAAENDALRLVAIGTSTGGPAALHRILIDLPRDFPVPVLVVQHMARGFIDGLAKWLGANVPMKVTVAAHGEPLVAGTVYIAPDDRHLGVSRDDRIFLSDVSPISGFRPSADYLFDSCAHAYEKSLTAVVLTGMGQDGVEGLRTVHERGGRVLAQDESSSVVFGMAKQAIEAGVVDEVLSLDSISRRLTELARSMPRSAAP